MYTLANVERFLEDNAARIQFLKLLAIHRRAVKAADPDGTIFAGSNTDIWQDPVLERDFGRSLKDPKHMEIAITAMKAGKSPLSTSSR